CDIRSYKGNIETQAFNALLFLYRNVLNISLESEKIDAVRARKKRNLPVVMTKDEIKKLIMAISSVNQLMEKLIYGSGLRLMEPYQV
ncbi:MAG: integron integrase, partial [Deltaproteobacteria bacterium]|nr:integron integrase [Deltaproteobacteria bacterium]